VCAKPFNFFTCLTFVIKAEAELKEEALKEGIHFTDDGNETALACFTSFSPFTFTSSALSFLPLAFYLSLSLSLSLHLIDNVVV